MTIELTAPVSCEYIVAMFYDGMISSCEAHRLIKLATDSDNIKEHAEEMIAASYGP
jgi:hypothetical protein